MLDCAPPPPRRSLLRCGICVLLLALLSAGRAAAQESAYCRKVRARAAGDAALLLAPQLTLQGIRFPSNGAFDTGFELGTGLQLRAALSLSPLDLYRGARVLRRGGADCAQHEAAADLHEAVERGADSARLAALTEQADYLGQQQGEWQRILSAARQRLAAGVSTLLELNDIQRRAQELERRLVQLRGEIDQLRQLRQLQQLPAPAPRRPLAALAEDYLRKADRFEHETAHLRRLDPFSSRLIAGISPLGQLDWYGMIEVGMNLGALARNLKETRYLEARADELRHAPYELPTRLRRAQQAQRAALTAAQREVEIIEQGLSAHRATRQALAAGSPRAVVHTRDLFAIEQITLEAERVYLRALIRGLSESLE